MPLPIHIDDVFFPPFFDILVLYIVGASLSHLLAEAGSAAICKS